LTRGSELVAEASRLLYLNGVARNIVYSTGHTSGPNISSEAEAMHAYVQNRYGHVIPKNSAILEENSLDTATNATECIQIAKKHGIKKVAILSTAGHEFAAQKLFAYYGMPIPDNLIFTAEKILHGYLYKKSPQMANNFARDYKDYTFFSGIDLREFIRSIMLSTIDPGGRLLNQITKRTRG
jgi:uncharacterized SAM-binding protein YcdF (DUF218 family)